MTSHNILDIVLIVSMLFVLIKNILGYNFPWKKCPCCGKRLDKNHKPISCRLDIEAIDKQLDRDIEMDKVENEIEEEFTKWDVADKKWKESDNNK